MEPLDINPNEPDRPPAWARAYEDYNYLDEDDEPEPNAWFLDNQDDDDAYDTDSYVEDDDD